MVEDCGYCRREACDWDTKQGLEECREAMLARVGAAIAGEAEQRRFRKSAERKLQEVTGLLHVSECKAAAANELLGSDAGEVLDLIRTGRWRATVRLVRVVDGDDA